MCEGHCCGGLRRDVSAVVTALRNWAEKDDGKRKIIASGSFGYYDLEPVVIIEKPGHSSILYAHVTEDVVSQLIRDYIEGDNPRPDLALCALGSEDIEGIPAAAMLPCSSFKSALPCAIADSSIRRILTII